MASLVVPRATVLQTALGSSAREALVKLANALAEEIEAAVTRDEKHVAMRMFANIVGRIDAMDRGDIRESRTTQRTAAAIDWMNKRNEDRNKEVAYRIARDKEREVAKRKESEPSPASALIADLRSAHARQHEGAA